jgi:toxin HigB-1
MAKKPEPPKLFWLIYRHSGGSAAGVVVIESRGLLHARLMASLASADRGLEFVSGHPLDLQPALSRAAFGYRGKFCPSSSCHYDVGRSGTRFLAGQRRRSTGRYACCGATHRASCKLTVDIGQLNAYVANSMIKSFKSKLLAELWEKGRTSKIDAKIHERILRRLDRLDAAAMPQEMNIPGFDFHALRGFKPTRYSVHVNGPWCITFEFEDGDACRVDFEQYH